MKLSVKTLHQEEDPLFKVVEEQFRTVIEPLYGDQTEALNKIRTARDRICKIIEMDGEPLGILVFKKATTNEFKTNGIINSIEIKTLFVIDAKKNSRRGIGSKMVELVEDYAMEQRANYIHVTVCSKKPESLKFFNKKGFLVANSWPRADVTEYLLVKCISNTRRPFKVPLRDLYLNKIRDGLKTCEGRINTGLFSKLLIGDILEFFSKRNRIQVRVTSVHPFNSFEDMLRYEGVEKLLPGEKSISKGVQLYRSFPKYFQKEKMYGVIAIGFVFLREIKNWCNSSRDFSAKKRRREIGNYGSIKRARFEKRN